jgi:glycosyltransferase involved in cell wall biosynthesis
MSTLPISRVLRVCIITGIFPPDIGGPATYVPRIAAALAERGHTITVLTLSDRLDHDDSEYGFRVVRLPRRLSKPWRYLRTVSEIIRLGQDADVLFVNGLAIEAVIANLWLGKPIVQKVVGDLAWEWATNRGWVKDGFETFQNQSYSLKIKVLKTLRTWWIRKANHVVVPSRYLAHWVAQWCVPGQKLAIIYNALETLTGIRPAQAPLRMPFKVVTVGRLIPLKRVDKVIQAVAQLEGVGLVIIGDGLERGRLEALASALGITDRVYFAGMKSKAETLALMATCDVLVLNSTHEAFPHVVLEAMALALPVVATAVGGVPEVVRDGVNGLLIESSEESMVQALSQLKHNDTLRRSLVEQGHKVVQRDFSVSTMVEQVEQLLVQVVTTPGQDSI